METVLSHDSAKNIGRNSQILHFYRPFLSDIMAVKGLIQSRPYRALWINERKTRERLDPDRMLLKHGPQAVYTMTGI